MQEIKCPKCGEVFQVDESGYAAIVKQVRDKEFTKELESREQQYESDKENAVQLAKFETEKELKEQLNQKEAKIAELNNQIASFNKDKELELNKLQAQMDAKLAEKENNITKLISEKDISEKEFLVKEH